MHIIIQCSHSHRCVVDDARYLRPGNRELSQPIRELSVPGQFHTGRQFCMEHRPQPTYAGPPPPPPHYVNFAMRWGTASKRASRRWAIPKRDSSLSGHWMGYLLNYSLSGGHDGAMLPINPRGLNGPLNSHFIFSSHMYFSLNTPTYYWSPMPN